ncbi:MAG: C1 family peptidase [Acetobacteraceae bacterium]|nr:C1 family peptidase [Acetobacteraceae bacterium]
MASIRPKPRAAGASRGASTPRILNCEPSRGIERDWTFAHAEAAGLAAATRPPPAIDLRADWWPVSDQGSSGACVGFSLADGVLRWHFVQAGRLAKAVRLAPRFIWMASKETDEFSSFPETFIESSGTSLKAALDIARKFGCVEESLLPFDSAQLFGGPIQAFYLKANQLKISSYVGLRTDLGEWRRWIAQTGPLLARLEVDGSFDRLGRSGKLTAHAGRGLGGHAVAIVGYDAKGFVIRNSWGTGWGRNGFAHATDAYVSKAFSEAYGVIA